MEEKIEKRLFTYCLYDKNTETYNMLMTGFDDKATIDYYINVFNDIYKSLNNYYKGEKLETEINNFKDKINCSCIYRVGYFDIYKCEFINDKFLLVDLFDFEFNKESEDKIDVKKSSD